MKGLQKNYAAQCSLLGRCLLITILHIFWLTWIQHRKKKGWWCHFYAFFLTYNVTKSHRPLLLQAVLNVHSRDSMNAFIQPNFQHTILVSPITWIPVPHHHVVWWDPRFAIPFPWVGHWETCEEILNNHQLILLLQTRFLIKLLPHWSDIVSKICPSSPPFDFAKNRKCSVNWRFSRYFFVDGMPHSEAVTLQTGRKCHQTAHFPYQ